VAVDAPEELLAQLCRDLRLLWVQAGGPSVRRLSAEVRLGKSQVSAILNGQIRALPDWDVVRGMVESVGRYAREHGRADRLSLRTGVEEYWRPRYALLEYAFSQPRPRREPAARPPASGRLVPRQLPPPARHFTGRNAELAELTGLVDRAAAAGDPVVISAIDGTAGIGKTTLAVHWAHQVADRFPDGQLYVNLRGFDPGGAPMVPAEAVRGFLDAFGVAPERIPVSLQAQADLYRSLVAGRRVLVVLDNARDADQVRPLLPGSPGCLAVVTSRNRLTSLVAAEGAYPITLDVLSAEEARGLLTRHLGAGRTGAEPAAVDDIVASCARLPIALAIVAARAATHPGFPLTSLADELADARSSLDALDGGDLMTDVRAVFSWSYERLGQPAARLFRLLGLHPGPDISAAAAASLAAVPSVRRVVEELARAHLVQERVPGRFAFHDLLRAYAAELATEIDADADRDAAIHRVLDHYLSTAHSGSVLISPHRDPIPPSASGPDPPAERLTDASHALAWFTAEHPVLLAVIRLAAATGFDAHAWRLSWTLADFFQRRGHWHDWAGTQRIALDAAIRLADSAGQAQAHRSLGRAYFWLGRHEEAQTQLRRALVVFTELDDHTGQARVHLDLVMMLVSRDQHREALGHGERSLALYRADGNCGGQARALNAVGWCHAQLGDPARTIEYCQQALDLHRDIGDRLGEAATWDSLGYARHQQGDHAQATVCYEQAIALFVETGDRYGQADTLTHLGDAHHAAGSDDCARKVWRDAVDILDELGHPAGDRVRARLDGLPTV
jgi:tetratricopeptide (TPR) repeat protein